MDISNTNAVGIQQVLQQMREISARTQLHATEDSASIQEDQASIDFSAAFKTALEKVNDAQTNAENLRTAFQQGDANVSLVDVTLASQKASLAFEATVQVRNRLINAYKEIMNMPV